MGTLAKVDIDNIDRLLESRRSPCWLIAISSQRANVSIGRPSAERRAPRPGDRLMKGEKIDTLIDTLIGTFYRSLVSIVTPSPDVYIATLPQYLPQVVEPLVSG